MGERATFPYRFYMFRYKCIFIHIPKSAGSSILKAITGRSRPRYHFSWDVYYSANPRLFRKYFKFSFVRDPMDRAFSAYRYLRRGGNQTSDRSVADAIGRYSSFEAFVISGLGQGYFRNHLLFRPQSHFVLGADGRLAVDFLGYYESLERDFQAICQRLGIEHRLPYVNTGHADEDAERVRTAGEENVSRIIREIYRQDYLAFGYG